MDGWLGVKAVLMIAYCNQKRLIQVDVNKYLVEVFLTHTSLCKFDGGWIRYEKLLQIFNLIEYPHTEKNEILISIFVLAHIRVYFFYCLLDHKILNNF